MTIILIIHSFIFAITSAERLPDRLPEYETKVSGLVSVFEFLTNPTIYSFQKKSSNYKKIVV